MSGLAMAVTNSRGPCAELPGVYGPLFDGMDEPLMASDTDKVSLSKVNTLMRMLHELAEQLYRCMPHSAMLLCCQCCPGT